MRTLLILSLLITSTSFAQFNIKPGLWTIETKLKEEGKAEYDPQAAIKNAMANMTPEQRKQVQGLLSKHTQSSVGFSSKGAQICYAGNMEKMAELVQQQTGQDCEATFPEKTATKMVVSFKCKNGSSGTNEMTTKDPMHYQGITKMTDKDGKKTEMHHNGTFTSSDCGEVKPISNLPKKSATKKSAKK